MMGSSLLQKLIVLFLGIFLCSAGALTYLTYESSREAILQEFNIRGRELAKAIALELRDDYEQGNVEGLTTHLQSMGDAEGVLAILAYKNNQEIWIESSIIELTDAELLLRQPQTSWQINRTLFKGAHVREFGNRVTSIQSAPSNRNSDTQALGWVKILLDRTPLQVRLTSLLMKILTSSTLIILSGGLLFVVLLRHSLKAIPPLIEATQRVAKGELTTMVPVTTQDELGQLTTWFNEMTAQLHKTTVSKNYVDNIIQSMMDTLIVVDPRGIIRTANQAAQRLLGYEESELIGQPFSLIFGGDGKEARQDLLQDILRKGTMSHIETTYIHKSGRSIPILFSSAVLYHEWRQPQGIACLGQDITERNKATDLIQFSHGLLEAIHGA
ncbi:MAG: PAS domain S-box protein, partial [Nitrospirota bacterium]|nr:PAS domain S-box protein [Nitrospirota bacterium]